MLLIAILVPALSFLLRGKIFQGIIFIILQVTLIGWLPAAFWAALSLNNARAEKRAHKIIESMRATRQ
ncbi:MAG: YqaE/Pmp3 family membrane protein [Sphingobacteriales bacterium]|nr:MAG: YqaE/Pmp3 family membrane protein [Sphingobacteriales bacterium]